MSAITLYLKTYSHHIEQADKLINSIMKYNMDDIPVVVSVNPNETELFKQRWDGLNVTVIDDRDIFQVKYPMDGWRYQQVVKSNFWRINPKPNYLCLDSDSVFISPFTVQDFIFEDNIPYTICHESKDMLEYMVMSGHDMNQVFYQTALETVRKLIPNKGPKWDWGPSPFIWSNKVWSEFDKNYLQQNNLTFDKFLLEFQRIQGYNFSEYTVYGEYLFYSKAIPIIPKQPLFKVYHWKEQFIKEFNSGVRASHLRSNYLGVITQSNWGLSSGDVIHTQLTEFFEN